MLEPGDRAPTFTLYDQNQFKWRLTEQLGSRVALFFYPKANTTGCTEQATGLRDLLPGIPGVVVAGISADPPDKQSGWDEKHNLGFPLLSDPEYKIAKKYGVFGPKKLYGREYQGVTRSMFLISPVGRVERVWRKVSPKSTPIELMSALEDIGE
jgi:peroxiredoxin Q/BCP